MNQERDLHLDFLRGVALLGLVMINIRGFASLGIGMINPIIWSQPATLDRYIWWLTTFLFQVKSMNMFSLLMGYASSGMQMSLIDKHLPVLPFFIRRYWILFCLGLAHMFLLWQGDVLALYSIGALILYPICGLRWPWIMSLGFLVYLSATVIAIWSGIQLVDHPAQLSQFRDAVWTPLESISQFETRAFAANWGAYLGLRLPYLHRMQIAIFPTTLAPQFFGCFLLGWGLRKLQRQNLALADRLKAYAPLLLKWGLSLCILGIVLNELQQWKIEYSLYFGFQWNYIGSLLIVLALFLMSDSIWKVVGGLRFANWMAQAGRLSLTHYFFQSLICAVIFYGWGFKQYGLLSLWVVSVIALTIWLLQVLISRIYLRSFKRGPFETAVRYFSNL